MVTRHVKQVRAITEGIREQGWRDTREGNFKITDTQGLGGTWNRQGNTRENQNHDRQNQNHDSYLPRGKATYPGVKLPTQG